MYNTKFVCTYNSSEVFLDVDNITYEEEKFIRDVIYRQELLNILDMDDYNEKEMNNSISELYQKIKGNPEFKECMLKLAGHFMSTDEEFGLMIMFAYDYMYATHLCVCEFLETGKISNKNIKKLKSLIF